MSDQYLKEICNNYILKIIENLTIGKLFNLLKRDGIKTVVVQNFVQRKRMKENVLTAHVEKHV